MAQRNRSITPKAGKARAALTLTHPNAAGIDIGSASHFVAVPPDRDGEPVREFKSFTTDLEQLASATARLKPSSSACRFMTASRRNANGAAGLATRRSSICAN